MSVIYDVKWLFLVLMIAQVYTLDGVTVHVSAVLTYRVVEARLD